jgi:hypothetical protein
MVEKCYPFHPKRVLTFLYAQAAQGDIHIERRSSHLTVQALGALFFVRWSSTYARLFHALAPYEARAPEEHV